MLTPLQKNSLEHLRNVLADLADAERQSTYKANVPFVHVPNELVEQWSEHAELLREQDWFRSLFSDAQVDALTRFDDLVEDALRRLGQLEDVPTILEHDQWRRLMQAAHDVLLLVPKETAWGNH